MMLLTDVSFDIVHSTTGDRKSPKKQALHLTCWVLCVDRTMHRNFSVTTFFPGSLVCGFLMKFITQELAFSFLLWDGNLK